MHLNDLFSFLSFANIAKVFLHQNMFLRKKNKITKATKPSQKWFKTSRAASNNCCVFWLANGCLACSSMVEMILFGVSTSCFVTKTGKNVLKIHWKMGSCQHLGATIKTLVNSICSIWCLLHSETGNIHTYNFSNDGLTDHFRSWEFCSGACKSMRRFFC